MSVNPVRRVGLTEAAQILTTLELCKAFSPGGKVNGPNVQRFGHRDATSGRWWWDVCELVWQARQKGNASLERIESVAKQYGCSLEDIQSLPVDDSQNTQGQRALSRAEVEKEFRDSLRDLESILRRAVDGGDKDTFGMLIHQGEQQKLFPKHRIAELSFVNMVRNCLNHSATEPIDDDTLSRALASVNAWTELLKQPNLDASPLKMKVGRYAFQYICDIQPLLAADNSVQTDMPQARYKGVERHPLNKYGKGPFCLFTIPASLHLGGVYALVFAEQVVYVGECADLSYRFNTGYGNISPRNCYKGGQETNCRLNNLIYTATAKGQRISLWFLPTVDYKSLEAELRVSLKPAWNRV